MSPGAELLSIVDAAEQALIAGLGLARLQPPPELAHLEGRWKGAPIALDARAYRGERTAYARFVRISAESLAIGNVLCLSRPEHPLPILGVDLVALGGSSVVAVADLSPVDPLPLAREQQLSALGHRRARAAALSPGGELPAWCTPWFSPHALFTRAAPSELDGVANAVEDFWRSYLELDRASRPDPSGAAAIRELQRAYCAAHVEHDRGLQLLTKMFEPGLAQRFLREVLFPEGAPPWA